MKRANILASAFTCCPAATPGFSGGEDVLGWNLVQQIGRHHEVWVITQEEDRQSIESTVSAQGLTGMHFHYVGLPSWLKPMLKFQGAHQVYYYLWQMRAYFAARKLHKKIGFDLFHHITYANDWMASFIGALLPIPYVRGPGGGAHRTPAALIGEYTFKGRIWERIRRTGQWLFRHDPFFIVGHRRASAILLCNNDAMSIMPSKWSGKLHLYPVSGVPLEDLALGEDTNAANDDSPTNAEFSVISAGSLIRVKGFGLAIKAFKKFSDKYPASRLTIVGSGPEEPRLAELVRSSHLEHKVELPGAIPRKDLLKKMASSDVLLFPSLRDGGGTVVIEAMSVGKPVVCLDIGGPGMHITEECGIKVTPRSPQETVDELAGALELLYNDEELRSNLGKAGRQKAAQSYTWERLGERLMEIYEPILGSDFPATTASREATNHR